MKVLVTGGHGQLGKVLVPKLQETYEVTVLDQVSNSDQKTVVVDILDFKKLSEAVRGHDLVVHLASLHGVHKQTHTIQDFIRVNAIGTCNLLQACVDHGVKKVIYASSTSVYGISYQCQKGKPVLVNESTGICPTDSNDLTKFMAELIFDYFGRIHGLDFSILRLGRFFEDESLELRKLNGAVDRKDATKAILLALEKESLEDKLFCIASENKFSFVDLKELSTHPEQVVEKYYPGIGELLEKNKLKIPNINRFVDISKAKKVLGFKPEWNFDVFYQNLKQSKGEKSL